MSLSSAALEALRTFPLLSDLEVDQEKLAAIHDEIIQRVGGMAYDPSPYAGQALCVRDDGSRVDYAANAGGYIGFGYQGVRAFKPSTVSVTGNLAITDALHCGTRLVCTNSGAITLTMALTGVPASGMTDGSVFQVMRAVGSGVVQFAFGSGIANGHPLTHTHVSAQKLVEVFISGGYAYLNGGTEP